MASASGSSCLVFALSFPPQFVETGNTSSATSFPPSYRPSKYPSSVLLAHVKSSFRHCRQWLGSWQQWCVGGGVTGWRRSRCHLWRLDLWKCRSWLWRWPRSRLLQLLATESVIAGATLEKFQAMVSLPSVSRTNLSLAQHRLTDVGPEVTGAT